MESVILPSADDSMLISEAEPTTVISLDDDEEEEDDAPAVAADESDEAPAAAADESDATSNKSTVQSESSLTRNTRRRSKMKSISYIESSDDDDAPLVAVKQAANNNDNNKPLIEDEDDDDLLEAIRVEPMVKETSPSPPPKKSKKPTPLASSTIAAQKTKPFPEPFSGYLCLLCKNKKSKFLQLKDMMMHVQYVHQKIGSKVEPNKVLCPVCVRLISIGNVQHFTMHRVLQRYFECEICKTEYPSLAAAVAHMRIHKTQMPPVKAATTKTPVASIRRPSSTGDVVAAMAAVGGIAPPTNHVAQIFKCGVCYKMFNSRSQCMSHRVRDHQNYFKCDFCSKEYMTSTLLDNCIRKHHLEYNIIPANPHTFGPDGVLKS